MISEKSILEKEITDLTWKINFHQEELVRQQTILNTLELRLNAVNKGN